MENGSAGTQSCAKIAKSVWGVVETMEIEGGALTASVLDAEGAAGSRASVFRASTTGVPHRARSVRARVSSMVVMLKEQLLPYHLDLFTGRESQKIHSAFKRNDPPV